MATDWHNTGTCSLLEINFIGRNYESFVEQTKFEKAACWERNYPV